MGYNAFDYMRQYGRTNNTKKSRGQKVLELMGSKFDDNGKLIKDLYSPDGRLFGTVSYDAYKAVKNFDLDSYMADSADEETKKILTDFRKHPGFTITTKDGKQFENITYDGYKAIKENNVDNYTPSSDVESKAISDLKTHTENLAKEERINSNPVFKRYNIDPATFSVADLEKWANEHNHTVDISFNSGTVKINPKTEGGFLGFGAKSKASKQEEEDAKVLLALASNTGNANLANVDLGPFVAAGIGFMDGLTFGGFSAAADYGTKRKYEKSGLPDELYVSPSQALGKTMSEHRYVNLVGDISGSIVSTKGVGELVRAGTAKVFPRLANIGRTASKVSTTSKVLSGMGKWVSTSPVAQNMINDGITFAITSAAREAGHGGSASDIFQAGLTGLASGGVSGGVEAKLGQAGLKFLFDKKLQHKVLPEIARVSLSNAAGGVAYNVTSYALSPADKKPTIEDMTRDFAVDLAFGAIFSAKGTINASKVSKTNIDNLYNKMEQDFKALTRMNLSKSTDVNGMRELAQNVVDYSDTMQKLLKGEAVKTTIDGKTIETVMTDYRFIGQNDYVKSMIDDLDTIKGRAKDFLDANPEITTEAKLKSSDIDAAPNTSTSVDTISPVNRASASGELGEILDADEITRFTPEAASSEIKRLENILIAKDAAYDTARASSVKATTGEVAIGDAFLDTKTGALLTVVDRDKANTYFKVVHSGKVTNKSQKVSNAYVSNHFFKENGQYKQYLWKGRRTPTVTSNVVDIEVADSVADIETIENVSETGTMAENGYTIPESDALTSVESRQKNAEFENESAETVDSSLKSDEIGIKVPFNTKEGLVKYALSHIGDKVRVTMSDGSTDVRTIKSVKVNGINTIGSGGSVQTISFADAKFTDTGFTFTNSDGSTGVVEFVGTQPLMNINEGNMHVREESASIGDNNKNERSIEDPEVIELVANAMIDTLKPDALDKLSRAYEKAGEEFSIDIFVRDLIDTYRNNGNLGAYAQFFEDGGEKVVETTEEALGMEKSSVAEQKEEAPKKSNVTVMKEGGSYSSLDSDTIFVSEGFDDGTVDDADAEVDETRSQSENDEIRMSISGDVENEKRTSGKVEAKAEISVNTNELPVKYTNLNEARKAFVEYAKTEFPKTVVNNNSKKEIGISRTGIDKFLSGNISIQKYATGFKIPELIESATKVGEATNKKGKPGITGYEYFDNAINIDGKEFAVHIRVRNTDMGDKYYGHTISQNIDDIKIEPMTWNSDDKSVHPINVSGSDKNSISQKDNTVNNNDMQNTDKYSFESEENANGRNDILHDNGNRGRDESAGEQVGQVSELEQENQSKTEDERKRTAKELFAKGKTKKTVIGNVQLNLVDTDAHNEDMQSIVQKYTERGMNVHFFVGQGIRRHDASREFKIDGFEYNGEAYLRYDGKTTPQKLAKHELVHLEWDSEAVQRAKEFILGKLSEEQKAEILELERYQDYMELYSGDEALVWEEFIADTLAGMNDYSARFFDIIQTYWNNHSEFIDSYKVSEYTESIDAGGVDNVRRDNIGRTDKLSVGDRNQARRGGSGERNVSVGEAKVVGEETNSGLDFERAQSDRSDGIYMENTASSAEGSNAKSRERTNGTRFLEAVKTGKYNIARQLLDEQAERNGFELANVYHGTQADEGFTRFENDGAIWVSTDLEYAKQYAEGNTAKSGLFISDDNAVFDLYAKKDKILDVGDVDKKISSPDEILNFGKNVGFTEKEILRCWSAGRKHEYKTIWAMTITPEFAEIARKYGYDTLKAVEDNGKVVTYGILYHENIKSAKLETYDDNGKLIPLEERFNTEKNELRFSITKEATTSFETQDRLEGIAKEIGFHDEFIRLAKKNKEEFVGKTRENESLQKRLKSAQRQMQLTPAPMVNAAKVGKITGEILAETNSTLKASEIKDDVLGAYNEYLNAVKNAGGVRDKVQIANENMTRRFADIAIDIVDSAEVYTETEEYMQLKDYIRTTRIFVPNEIKSDVNYAEFRKRNMGTFNLTNDGVPVDVVYSEMCEIFPGLFDEKLTNAADCLLAMEEVLNGLKPVAYNPYADYMQDAIEHIVFRFVSEADGIAVMSKTKAQKIAEKSAYDKAMALEKERAAFERKFEKQKERSEGKIQALQKQMEEFRYTRFWERKLYGEEKKQAIKTIRERQKIAKLKSSIRKIVSDMKANLDKNEKTGGYPKELVKTVAEVCSVIDFHTDRPGRRGETNKSNLRLDALKAEYDALKDCGSYDFESEYSEELSEHIRKLHEAVKGKRVIDLNAFELENLKDILSEIRHRLSTAKKQIGIEKSLENVEIGTQIINDLENQKAISASEIRAFVLNPHRVNEMIAGYDKNSAWWKTYEQLNRGVRKAAKFTMDATRPFDELTNGNGGNEVAFYEFRTKMLDTGIKYIDGTECRLPKTIVCELVMAWDRKQGRKHLETGGAKIPKLEWYNKGKTAKSMTEGAKRTMPITQADITRLRSLLDSYDSEWIEKAGYLFNNVSKQAINETSMGLVGREIAKAENYIRLYVDKDFVRSEIEGIKVDASIEGNGSLKKTTQNATQPLVLRGLHENVYDQIDFTAKYSGLAIPIRNFNKVYNVVCDLENGGRSVKEVLGKKYGTAIQKGVVEQLVRELQTPRERSFGFYTKIRGKWLGATFWGNISSTIKQTTSYWTASALLDESALVKGMKNYVSHPRVTRTEIHKHTGSLYKREQGLSTTELGERANSKRLAGASNWTTKVINRTAPWLRNIPEGIRPGNWLQSMDCTVAAALWEACKVQVAKTTSTSDAEYMQAVTDLYDRVIEETQSNYDLMHRPEALKNTNPLVQTVTMFKTDNLQQTGILYNSYGNFKTKRKAYQANKTDFSEAAYKDAKKRFSKAVRSRLWSTIWMSVLAQPLIALILRKFKPYFDEEENDITAKSILEQMMMDAAGDMFGVLLPIAGDLVSDATNTWLYGYDFITEPSFDVLQEFIESTSKIYNAFTDEDGDVFKAYLNAIPSISNLTGIPAKNIMDWYNSISGYIGDVKAGEFVHNKEDYASSRSLYTHADIASCITTGDKEQEEKILNYYKNNNKEINKGSLTREIKPAYIDLFVDEPSKVFSVKKKLVIDYGYSSDSVDAWVYDAYFKNLVSDAGYAAEIKAAAEKAKIDWSSKTIKKKAKSAYKALYKEGEGAALKAALMKNCGVSSSEISTWEREVEESKEESEKKRKEDVEQYE